MQQGLATTVFLPIALGIIMFGLGLSLTLADFRRILAYPKAVAVGLVCQSVLLPAICFGLVKLLGLAPELAVGFMLLAASPGGATANLFSHLAKGDVALNITLTAVNSLVSLFTLPFIVSFALTHFMGTDVAIPMQLSKVVSVFAVVLVPVAIGMIVHAKKAALATRLGRPVKIASALFLVVVVLAAVLKERANLGSFFAQVGAAALLFNLASMGIGYVVPVVVRLPRREAIAISMEIGIHNGTLAIAIAMSPLLLDNARMAVPAAIYSLVMFVTAAVFGVVVSRRSREETARALPTLERSRVEAVDLP
ncbi:MAG: bile acid:sodium symporter family protein [Deltaproteobacteria bacterium]|nr:bile acid:sodium symporter family protein [Deltaproteobacteria bacterium]